jgi:predicted alpha/beta superfamily hydrolase
MFHNPMAFSTYCVSSPSIWYNDREVLAGEADFAKRARSGELQLRILVNSAGDEQPPNAKTRMIDNASELAARLAALNPSKVSVTRTIFPGESHVSVVSASLVRSLRFALGMN